MTLVLPEGATVGVVRDRFPPAIVRPVDCVAEEGDITVRDVLRVAKDEVGELTDVREGLLTRSLELRL